MTGKAVNLRAGIEKAAKSRLVSVASQLEYARYHGNNSAKKSALWGELAELLETLGARRPCPRCADADELVKRGRPKGKGGAR